MSDANGPKKPGSQKPADGDAGAESGKASPDAEVLKPGAQGQGKGAGAEPQRKRPKVLDGKAEEVKADAPKGAAGTEKAGGSSESAGSKSAASEAGKPKTASTGGKGGGNGNGGDDAKSPPPLAASPASHLHLISGLISGIAGAAAVVVIAWHFGIAEPDGTSGTADAVDANKQAIADIADRMESVESGQPDVQAAIGKALEPLDARLGGLEQEVAARDETAGAGGGASTEAVEKLTARLDALEERNAGLADTITEANKAAVAAQNRLGEMQAQLPSAGLDDKVARLDAMIGKLGAQIEKLEPQLQRMETRLAALEQKADDPDAAQRAALALALANLSRAIEGAGPFETELETVSSFLPKEEVPAALDEAAANGVPTRAALKDRFEPLIEKIFDAARREGDSSIWDRFLANAASLVTVRRTGEISGDSTEAVVARMEEKLKEGDLAGAVAQGETLKGAAADAAAPWMADARKRLDAEKLVRELTARVTARLAELKG
ncbi:putative coiled-coil protein SlyX [Parvibaculum indicum]|uniref:COG4223 family protein n=1 Tax=Parvibaculum indicum TaxID=562969 RepID=UPI00141DF3CC|nr:mitofilin family membrane protein [Parvibaculum indicum]NIJ43326.1 putative coiled-coil protein SlyX [Parvibaculum indicum]